MMYFVNDGKINLKEEAVLILRLRICCLIGFRLLLEKIKSK
jgi:hypothetical protein